LFAGCPTQPDEQVALAVAAVAEQHDGFASVHVVPGAEVAHGGGRNGGHGVDVEVREPFSVWETSRR